MTASRPTFSSLSFIRRGRKADKLSNWHMPPPPDNYVEARRVQSDGSLIDRDCALYGIGCQQGKDAAREWVNYVQRREMDCGGTLQFIVFGMRDDAPDGALLRGQIVGFFTTIESLLEARA